MYALTFPWVKHVEPWQTSLGIVGIRNATDAIVCPDWDAGFLFRTFSSPLLSVIATSMWTKAVAKREAEKQIAKEAAYQRSSLKHNRTEENTRAPPPGFLIFCEDEQRAREDKPGHHQTKIQGVLTQEWQALSAEERQSYEKRHESDMIFIANIKYVVATSLMFVSVYSSVYFRGNTGLQTITLLLASALLTYTRWLTWESKFRKCRDLAMFAALVWFVAIVMIKYCYKSRGFRKLVRVDLQFPASALLDSLPAWVQEWAPEYSPRDLLDDIGLFTSDTPSFWSQQDGATFDILPEMLALVVIGAIVRSKAEVRQSDPFRYVIPMRRKWDKYIATQYTLLLQDLAEAARVGCIALIVWMGAWELSLFNSM